MRRALLSLLLLLSAASAAAAQTAAPQPIDPQTDEDITIQSFLQAVETAVSTTSRAAWLDLLSANADRDAATEFFDSMMPQGVTRAVIRERDRAPLMGALPGEGFGLVVEIFIETGARGRIMTWRLDIRRPRDSTERQPWRLVSEERLSTVEGLHRLSLHPDKQFVAHDLLIKSVDFELRLPAGAVFVAETAEGVTALVLVGDGTMLFAPEPSEERGQVRIFAGADTIETPFTTAYVRLNPYEFDQLLKQQTLAPTPADSRIFRRAKLVFDEEVSKSFSLDLSYMSRDTWSLLPQAGDFLAEVRTRRFDTLTYARSTGEPEDVSLFHRQKKKNISAYASAMKLSSRGRFYNEDDLVEYDVLDYNINATFIPDRDWLDGRARLKIRIKAYALGALTLKLSDDFTVKSITSEELGRLLFLRVRYQNSVVVNLPSPVARDLELTLDITYSGPIRSQSIDQESVTVQDGGRQRTDETMYVAAENKWLFSNRSHWYPQGQVTDYATATIQVTVPGQYTAVASGVLQSGAPAPLSQDAAGQSRMTYVFSARQPVRYLGLVVSRMNRVDAATIALDITPPPPPPADASGERLIPLGRSLVLRDARGEAPTPIGGRNTIALAIEANKRQETRGRDLTLTAADVLRLYSSLIGDAPYEAMTVAMLEDSTPGGHSPGYFAVIHNALPMTPYLWRNDPASFQNFPEFYIAHEMAHQWFGQAVGWKNYHEQWLSEGFAQYFAALFAKEKRGESAFREVLRQFRRWALSESDQGAIYLGYRLGHLKSDTRTFRALVYNKGAGVLHMLRRLIGEDVFFRGVRRFYAENRFKKAGTADLQRAMEAEAGHSLDRFFQRWIYESGIPRIRYSAGVEGQEVVVRFEQVRASAESPLYDVPVTVAIHSGDKTVEDVVIISEASVEKRYPLSAALRSVDVNPDGAALAVFERR